MVIWSEIRMGQYRDDDHREQAPDFITIYNASRTKVVTDIFDDLSAGISAMLIQPLVDFHCIPNIPDR